MFKYLVHRNKNPNNALLMVLIKSLSLGLLLLSLPSVQSQESAIAVVVQPLSSVTVRQNQTAPATVVPANRAIIAAQVSAEIISIKVDVGEQVKKGDVLAQLDALDYQLALEQAQATLKSIDAQIAQANDRLKRAQELSGSQFISADDLLGRQTDVTVLNANRISQQVAIRIAKNNLAKVKIRAPFDAAVVSRSAQQGSYVTAATPMFELVQLTQREVEARVAVNLVQGMTVDANAEFVRSDQSWPLKVMRISPVVESDSGIQRVRLSFTEDPAAIGMSGQIRWSNGANLLPADMIQVRDGKLGTFYADNNIARFFVIANAQEGRPALVDLPADTLLITNGRYRLQDNTAITVRASN